MKPGTLVKLRLTIPEVIWSKAGIALSEANEFREASIMGSVFPNDVGIVCAVSEISAGFNEALLMLSSGLIGWIYEECLEVC